MDVFIPTDSIALVKAVLSAQVESFPDERTGQILYNHFLPHWACIVVVGSLFDPFQRDYDFNKLHAWCEEHLIFDTYGICAVYNGDKVLAERPPQEN